jgi:outer membrane protein
MRLFIFSFFAAQLFSLDYAHTADVKIAYINMTTVINDIDEGRAYRKRLNAEHQKKQAQFMKLQKEFERKQAAFNRKQGTMSHATKMREERELQRELFQLQQTQTILEQELANIHAEVISLLKEKIQAVVKKISEKEKYTLVLNAGDDVVYYKGRYDITRRVILEYNKTHRGR